MSETADRYTRVADGFTERVVAVTAAQWADPSPCADWTARDVVVHVVTTHVRVLANLDGAEAPDVDGDGDLVAQWRHASAAVLEALEDPERASRTVSGMFGEQSFASLVGRLVCTDTLVHTWDLARATGQDDRLDPDAAAQALVFLTPLDEAVRRPGGFGPRVDVPAGADAQAALLGFCGREA